MFININAYLIYFVFTYVNRYKTKASKNNRIRFILQAQCHLANEYKVFKDKIYVDQKKVRRLIYSLILPNEITYAIHNSLKLSRVIGSSGTCIIRRYLKKK